MNTTGFDSVASSSSEHNPETVQLTNKKQQNVVFDQQSTKPTVSLDVEQDISQLSCENDGKEIFTRLSLRLLAM